MDELDSERLIPAGEAWSLLAQEHDRRGTCRDWDECKQAALQALLPRLLHGQLKAWASGVSIDSTDPRPGGPNEIFNRMDFLVQKGPCEVDLAFWCNFTNAPAHGRTFDPVTGDFRFDFFDDEYRNRTGHAFAVYFDRRGLPPVAVPSLHGGGRKTASIDDAELSAIEAERASLLSEVAALKSERAALQTHLAEAIAGKASTQALRPVSPTVPPVSRKGRRADLPEAILRAWWEWQDDETRECGHEVLEDLCAAAFPRNHISRERIRRLAPNRKRGPKPKICADSR